MYKNGGQLSYVWRLNLADIGVMESIFIQSDSGDKPLVKTSNFKDHYPGVHLNSTWNKFETYIRQAVEIYVLPYIGPDLYNDIANKVQAENVPAELDPFLEKLRDCVAAYTVYHCIPMEVLTIANFGVQEHSSTDGSSTPARQWSVNMARWEAVKTADRLLDSLIMYMDANKNIQGNYFVSNWIEKEVYGNDRDPIFRDPTELSKYLNINKSRRAYIRLVPHIDTAIRRHIIPLLCQKQYDAIVVAIKEGSETGEQKLLIEKVKCVLANYALYIGIPHLRVQIEDTGLLFATTTMSELVTGTITSGKAKADEVAVSELRHQAEADAKTFRADALAFLYDNKDDYPLWRDSSCCQGDVESDFCPPRYGIGGVFF